jgi:malonyl-CoA reductase / 3-hydroxypropionate dehydrogenase (NADP+)
MSNEARQGRLSHKVALITGGSGSIGEVVVQRYLAEGATVVITGRDEQKLNAYRERLIGDADIAAERLTALRMDGGIMAEVRAGLAEVMQRLGRIDVLVNLAGGTGARQRLPDIPLTKADLRDDDSETLGEGVAGLIGSSWNVIRAAVPHMRPGSAIINVSTIFSRTNYYGRIPYVVPKAALNALGEHLANELGAGGIRVNTIYPGPIEGDRIRSVLSAMDQLKKVPENTTAEEFFSIMRLSRSGTDGTLTKAFPDAHDVAETVVFLGSDASAAFSGQAFEVTNGMSVGGESCTTLVSRPGLRAVDATSRTILICAGDQVEDAMALTGVLRSVGAEVVIGFRSRAAIAQLELILQESRRMQATSFSPPLLVHLDPLDTDNVGEAFNWIQEYAGVPDGVVILPAYGIDKNYPAPAVADDETVSEFLQQEITGVVAMARHLAHFWQQVGVNHFRPDTGPRVLFLSNGDDRRGNVYADIWRAAVEELCRVWRHEAAIDAQQEAGANGTPRAAVWVNQVVRYTNPEHDSLDFASAWVAQLINSERRIHEINLYLPREVLPATGAQRPSFGWAESLIGLHLGKVALITGGSAGIGGQVGRLLALSGARVMLAARGAAQLEQLRNSIVQELEEVGYNEVQSRVQIMAGVDVGDEESLALLVERTLATFGRVDYLINNAGIAGQEEMVIDMPHAGWRHTLNANLISNYSLIRKLAPLMKAQGAGYILNVSSYFGGEKYVSVPYPNRSDYAVSKAGQRAMAEVLARFMGSEIQINALAPGPVEGDRLRGTGERPGLFARRARLILENKRLNEIHAALIESLRASGRPVTEFLPLLSGNDVHAMAEKADLPEPLHTLARSIEQQGEAQGTSSTYLLNRSIASKLLRRLIVGGYLPANAEEQGLLAISDDAVPPEPFFARTPIERQAAQVRDGVMAMLYLQRMPTEFDVASATVYYLADRAVTGETFHPSGGLRFERTGTEGELFGQATPERLEQLKGSTVFLIGEYLVEHLITLAKSYLDTYGAARVVFITETEDGAQQLLDRLPEHREAGRAVSIVSNGDLEMAIDRACHEYGRPVPVVSMPFRALPACTLVGSSSGDWSRVMSEADFADLVEQQITHHFRVAQKISLMDNACLAMCTPETTVRSTTEEFALANFVKTTMHAFTSTIGVEGDRTVHRVPVNQVDLTRRARAEEPRKPEEEASEMRRFVDAVMLATAPPAEGDRSRYMGRINRGKAITV